ncbi:GFA family protein [Alteromonas sp. ASW11-130]|uniref:GFA family protein n=1 Tax=Alteromonas sp. ASW11-130 TaxID=3015775 RepID=UPI002242133F|nr:GFA family protein [Alteromonas sp. ASW11-130]MCW8093342.1 GFA family protein [Alteromonas sp. ASW11-130]
MYEGSCLCGAVKLAINGPISSIIHCHCSLCRKSSGTAYATNGFIQKNALAIVRGEDTVQWYEIKPGRKRHFCKKCASPLFSSNATDPERLRLRIGIVDSDIDERPISHNFVSSKANWDNLDDDLPRYDSHEPGR